MKLFPNNKKIQGFRTYPRVSSLHTKRGFTLIEIMVSIAIFTIIITIGIGALVSVIRSYEVSQQEKDVHDELNYALESMTREIRLGKDYYPDADSDGSDQGTVGDGIGTSLGFNASDNRGYVVFHLDNGALVVTRSGATPSSLNGTQYLTEESQITVTDIRFTVLGTDSLSSGDRAQPLVWIQIKASTVGTDRETTVQTLASQRPLDA